MSDQLGDDVVARADKRVTQRQAQKEGAHRTSSDRASGLISGGEMPDEMGMVSEVAQQQAREQSAAGANGRHRQHERVSVTKPTEAAVRQQLWAGVPLRAAV